MASIIFCLTFFFLVLFVNFDLSLQANDQIIIEWSSVEINQTEITRVFSNNETETETYVLNMKGCVYPQKENRTCDSIASQFNISIDSKEIVDVVPLMTQKQIAIPVYDHEMTYHVEIFIRVSSDDDIGLTEYNAANLYNASVNPLEIYESKNSTWKWLQSFNATVKFACGNESVHPACAITPTPSPITEPTTMGPTIPSTTPRPSAASGKEHLSGGYIALIVICLLILAGITIFIIYKCCKKRSSKGIPKRPSTIGLTTPITMSSLENPMYDGDEHNKMQF